MSPAADRADALFVQSSAAFSSADGAMTLHDPAAATVFFTDGPRREAGHLPTRRFVELWKSGREGFGTAPPTAVVAFVDPGDGADTVVVLREARMDGGALVYVVDVVEGRLPERAGACTLFIDTLDHPLSPVLSSARGARRRGKSA